MCHVEYFNGICAFVYLIMKGIISSCVQFLEHFSQRPFFQPQQTDHWKSINTYDTTKRNMRLYIHMVTNNERIVCRYYFKLMFSKFQIVWCDVVGHKIILFAKNRLFSSGHGRRPERAVVKCRILYIYIVLRYTRTIVLSSSVSIMCECMCVCVPGESAEQKALTALDYIMTWLHSHTCKL